MVAEIQAPGNPGASLGSLSSKFAAHNRLRQPNFSTTPTTIDEQFRQPAVNHLESRPFPSERNRTPWIPLKPPLSSSRSPASLAEPALAVVLLSAVSNSWTIRLAPSSATSRARSARTIFSACSSLNVRPGVCDKRRTEKRSCGGASTKWTPGIFLQFRSSLRKIWLHNPIIMAAWE